MTEYRVKYIRRDTGRDRCSPDPIERLWSKDTVKSFEKQYPNERLVFECREVTRWELIEVEL